MRARRPISVQRIIVAVAALTIALVLGVASRPPIAAAQDTIPLTQCWNWANNEYRAWQGLSDNVEAVDDVVDPDGSHQRDLDMWGFTAAAANLIGNDSGNKIGGVLKSGIAYRLYANPTHADAFELKTDGSFYYSPQANYYGGDSFQYVWTATGYCSNIATVTILPFANPRFHDDTYRVDPIPPDGQVVDPLTPPAEGPSFRDDLCAAIVTGEAQPLGLPPSTPMRMICGFAYNDENFKVGVAPLARIYSPQLPGPVWRTAKGWFWQYSDGRFGYRPDPGATGVDIVGTRAEAPVTKSLIGFGLHAEGNQPGVAGQITFRIEPVPAVAAIDDGPLTVTEDSSLPIDLSALLANDEGTGVVTGVQRIDSSLGRPPTVRTQHGTLAIDWFSLLNSGVWQVNGLTYTPDPDYVGPDSFVYAARAGVGQNPSAYVKLDVVGTDDPPVANNDHLLTWSGAFQPVDVLANDWDPDGDLDPASLRLLGGGTPFSIQNGKLGFDAPDGFWGARIAQYDVADERGVRDDASVTIRISPLVPDSYTVQEDQVLTVPATGVRANDAPSLEAPATVQVATEPAHGTVVLEPGGAFTYTPAANFQGTDTFTYRAVGGDPAYAIATETATVTIGVVGVVDYPVIAVNTACPFGPGLSAACESRVDVRSVFEGGVVRLRGSITDPDPDLRGTLRVFWGDGIEEQFPYPCDPASFGVVACPTRVTPQPTWFGPQAQSDRVFFDLTHRYGDEGSTPGPYTISLVVSDPSGASVFGTATAGVTGVAPTVTTGPDCDIFGEAECPLFYSRLVMDGIQPIYLSTRVTDPGDDDVTVTIDWGDGTDDGTILADCSAGAVCARVAEHAASCASSGTLASDAAACGYDALRSHLYASAGTYTITLSAVDEDGLTSTATTTAVITVPNAVPSADDDGYTVAEDASLPADATRNVLANDTDPDDEPLTATVKTEPTLGTLDLDADGTFSYTPNADANGADGFTYRACDAADACAEAIVSITITPVNDPPTVGDDAAATSEDAPVTIPTDTLLANDTDVEGDLIQFSDLGQPDHGSVELTAAGASVTYTPDPDYNGDDAFSYDACDTSGACATATVRIDVGGVNDTPVAVDDEYATDEDQELTVAAADGLLDNDVDVDGDELTVDILTTPANGALTSHADGSFNYVPQTDWFGEDSFTYRVSDGHAWSEAATVTITVRSANDLPALAVAGGSCLSDATASGRIQLRVGDLETAAGGLSLSAVSSSTSLIPAANLVAGGSGANRTLVITAAAKKTGKATVTVTVLDANGGRATLVIAVAVGGAKSDTLTGVAGTDLMFGLAGANTLVGGPSDDTSIDVLCGGTGTDTLRGLGGADVLDGASGADVLEGGAGDDTLLGGGGTDTLLGGGGDDLLGGGDGVDRLRGDAGADRFDGGAGADVYEDVSAAEGDTQAAPG